MRYVLLALCALLLAAFAFVFYRRRTGREEFNPAENLAVTSAAFKNGGNIPAKYTGRGADVSPPLSLGTLAPQAKTIAILMDDLDHPLGTYNHWVIWNIPACFSILPEGVPREESVVSLGNAIQGKSGYGAKHWYRGPKPPFGIHKYRFKVYVLDTFLELKAEDGKAALQKAMEGHVLQYGTLTGLFGK